MAGFAKQLSDQEIEALKPYLPAGAIYAMDWDEALYQAKQNRDQALANA